MLAGYSCFGLRMARVVLFHMYCGLGGVGTSILLGAYCRMIVEARIGSCSISYIVINKRHSTPLFSSQVQSALFSTSRNDLEFFT